MQNLPSTMPHRTDATVFDPSLLGTYSVGNPELEAGLISLFRQQLAEQLQFLNSCTSLSEWRLVTHTIKGAAWAMGAGRIADEVEWLETRAPEADPAAHGRQLAGLSMAVAEFEGAISLYIAGQEQGIAETSHASHG